MCHRYLYILFDVSCVIATSIFYLMYHVSSLPLYFIRCVIATSIYVSFYVCSENRVGVGHRQHPIRHDGDCCHLLSFSLLSLLLLYYYYYHYYYSGRHASQPAVCSQEMAGNNSASKGIFKKVPIIERSPTK